MNRLRELRKRNKWTQGDLAERSGVSQGKIHIVEVYQEVPVTQTATKLAQAFGVKVSTLFPGGTRNPAYRKGENHPNYRGRAMRGDGTRPLCHWCGLIYDPADETLIQVYDNGRVRTYGHEKCRQEHLDTQAYA